MTAIALPRTYKHITTPTAWNLPWLAGKQAAGSGQVNVVIIGDSITQGLVSSSFRTKSYAGLIKLYLESLLGKAGEFIGTTESRAAGLGGGSGFAAGEDMWSVASGAWAVFQNGMCGWSTISSSASGSSLLFTPIAGLTFTALDLHIQQEPTGSPFTVTADGSPITATGGSGLQTCLSTGGAYNRHVKVPFDGLAPSAHPIAVTGTANAPLRIGGITVYPTGRTTHGVIVNRVNLGGKNSGIGQPLYGSQLDNTASAFYPYQPAWGSIQDFNPKLTIINLGVNDCNQSFGWGITRYNLCQLAQAAMNAGSAIIFMAPNITGPTLVHWEAWPMYVAEIANVARIFNAAFCNVHSFWGGNAQGQGLAYTDNIHWTDAGHQSAANFVKQIL